MKRGTPHWDLIGRANALFCVAVLAVCVCPSAARAFGTLITDEFGLGSRDTAMGMTGTAAATDFTAAYYNPAALLSIPYTPVSWSQYQATQTSECNRPSPQQASAQPQAKELEQLPALFNPRLDRIEFSAGAREIGRFFSGPQEHPERWQTFTTIGAVFRPCEKRTTLWDWIITPTLGIATMVMRPDVRRPADDREPVSIRSDSFGIFPSYVALAHQVPYADLLPSYARNFTIGAAMAVYAFTPNSNSEALVGGSIVSPQLQSLRLSNPLRFSFAPEVGVLYRSDEDQWKLGFTYRGGVISRGVVNASSAPASSNPTAPPSSSLPPPARLPLIVAWAPQQFAGGFACEGYFPWVFTADLVFKKWDEFVSATGQHPAPGFKNRLVPRVGAEYHLSQPIGLGIELVGIRGGYYFEPTPVPAQSGATNFIDNDQHVFSAGLAFIFDNALIDKIELFAQAHVMADRSTRKTDATDPFFPGYRVSGSEINFGLMLTSQLRMGSRTRQPAVGP